MQYFIADMCIFTNKYSTYQEQGSENRDAV